MFSMIHLFFFKIFISFFLRCFCIVTYLCDFRNALLHILSECHVFLSDFHQSVYLLLSANENRFAVIGFGECFRKIAAELSYCQCFHVRVFSSRQR